MIDFIEKSELANSYFKPFASSGFETGEFIKRFLADFGTNKW